MAFLVKHYNKAMKKVTITHWLPIITICPVNYLPDPLFIEVTFHGDDFNELYQVRKKLRRVIKWRKCYMEEVAKIVALHFPTALEIKVRLWFNKHIIHIRLNNE